MCLTRMRPYRVLLALVFGLCGVFVLYLLAPSPVYPISGLLLPNDVSARVVPANQVQLFSANQLPADLYKVRGHVSLVWHSPKASIDKERSLIDKARQDASANGANAIIMNVLGHTARNVSSQWASYRLEGQAVYVPQLELLRPKEASS